jgi:protein-arginine kinase activator protein McsA
MVCSECGKELPEDYRQEKELVEVKPHCWAGHTMHVKTIQQIRTDPKNPLCEDCWKRFITYWIGP